MSKKGLGYGFALHITNTHAKLGRGLRRDVLAPHKLLMSEFERLQGRLTVGHGTKIFCL